MNNATIKKDKVIKPLVDNLEIPIAEEIPLEQVIDNSLVKHNVTDMVIASLKEKYSGMQLKSLEDKEGYLDIKDARKEVRKVGILTEKICKHGREDAIKIQKMWLNKEKEILGKIAEVEEPLNVEIEKYENEIERKELEAAKEREAIFINRQAELFRLGAKYDNGSFILNHISYEAELLKQCDYDMWNDTILPKYKKVYEELEAIKVEEENKRKAELEQQRKEREEFEAKQKEFQKQQDEFAGQQRKLQEQKDAHEREIRLAQEKKDSEDREKKQVLIDARIKRLNTLNITLDYRNNQYVFIDEAFHYDIKTSIPQDLSTLSDTEWDELFEILSPLYEAQKKIVEEKRLAKVEEEKNAAVQKALEDEENKKKLEEEKRQNELAMAKDKEKYADVVAYLKKTPIHAMASNIYKSKMSAINDFISDL